MAKKQKQITEDKNSSERVVKKQFRVLFWAALFLFILILGLNVGLFFQLLGREAALQSREFFLSTGVILVAAVLVMALISGRAAQAQKAIYNALEKELGDLRLANKRARSLQEMASTLRATLNFERVVNSALDVCNAALEEMGLPPGTFAGAILLYEGDILKPVAHRGLARDSKQVAAGEQGAIAEALQRAEPVVTNEPRRDPEISQFSGFRGCTSAVAVPLRVEFQIYGVMIVATKARFEFSEEHIELFTSVADQAVIALRNAQLYQNLEQEKQRLIESDAEARKQLARDLHDGPTQSVAAIAMRINFVRSLLQNEPETALEELEKVEELAKKTGKEIRGMLFTLRPLTIVGENGLAASVENVMKRIEELDGLKMQLAGGEYGDLLNIEARGVVFQIIEEALGNARKYSEASLVEVSFWEQDGFFVAQVKDDGVGFDVEEVTEGYEGRGSLGMLNMRERAEMVDGSVNVESAPGEGTTITLIVPLAKYGAKARV